MAKRLGICIGVNTYQNKPTANLKFARRDAESIASLLKNTEYGGFDKVLEIYDDEANKASLIQTAKEIFLNPNLDSDDLIVFFFSGHGAVDRGEKLFLVPHDVKFLSDGSIDVSSVLHINELESFIDNSNSKNIVLLFDACHSGASSKLLGKIKYQDDTNVVLIGAARYSEKAWETPELEHGRFTESFLRCVNLVPSQGEWITLQQSLSFVQTEMQKMGSDQLMEVSSHAINQNIKLFKNPIYKLTSDEFTEQVKNLCEISNCTIVPIQSDLLLSNTFVMRESRSFGRFDQTLVICLDNSQIKLTTDNLIQFSSLFQSLQSEEIVTNGMLIVQNEISKIIRKSIDKSIAVQTLDEMQRNLMNFDRYLKQLVDDFTKGDPDRKGEPPLGEYYIELTAQKIFTLREIERKFESASINSDKNITNLIETILRLKIEERNSVLKSMLELSEKPSSSPELKSDLAKRLKFVYELFKPENISDLILGWLSDSDEKAVIILGGYGTGKTTFSRKLAYDLAQKYRLSTNKNGLRIPILFHLRRFPKFSNVDIEAAIIAHLKQQCLVSNPDFEAFKTMNRAGLFVLIFDGFDEMAVQGSNDIIRRNFIEIMEFARESNAKVIITSRPEAFLSDHEENEILQINDGFTQAEFPKLSRIILNTLSTTQVELFLQKRIPLIDKVVESGKGWEYYRDQINNIMGLKELTERPVLLDMTIKTLPKLLERGGLVTRQQLYETYISGEIERQQISKKRDFMISDKKHRMHLIQLVAIALYEEGKLEITVEKIQSILHSELTSEQKLSIENYVRDFIACSFLARQGDQYRFSHLSFMEYLIGKSLASEIEMDSPNKLKKFKLTPAVRTFVVEFFPTENTKWRDILWSWIKSTKQKNKDDALYLGGNSITLLNFTNEDLSGKDFSGTQLHHANLGSANLSGSVFYNCNLENTDFSKAIVIKTDFRNANLRNAKFSNIIINKKDATPEMIRKHLENSKLLTGANIQDIKVGDTLLKTISGILEGMTSGFEKSGINIETLVTTALIKALSLNQSK